MKPRRRYSSARCGRRGRPSLEGREVRAEHEVGADANQLARQVDLAAVLGERLARPRRRHLVEVGVDGVDGPPGGDQLLRRLLADTLAPRDVVRGVAHQGEDLAHRCRRHAEDLFDAALVEEPLQARMPHLDQRVGHELHQVLVARRDHHLEAGTGCQCGQRADHVVGLDVGLGQHGEAQQRDGFLRDRHLDPEVVGHRRPVRLVALVEPRPERLAAGVERHRDVAGLELPQHLVLHPEEAVRRVGGRAVGRGEAGADGEEGAVQVGVSVHQEQAMHGKTVPRRQPPRRRRPPAVSRLHYPGRWRATLTLPGRCSSSPSPTRRVNYASGTCYAPPTRYSTAPVSSTACGGCPSWSRSTRCRP